MTAILILAMVVLNIRGVKESITMLAPIFVLFLVTHAILLVYAFASRAGAAGEIVAEYRYGARAPT